MHHNSMMNMTMVHLVLEDMMEDKDRTIDGMDHLINHHNQILVVMAGEIRMMITLVDGMEADMDGLIMDLAVIRMDRHHKTIRRIIREIEERNEQFILVNTILLLSIQYVYY